MVEKLLRTSVVGSYPQPDWLVDKNILHGQFVPRVSMDEVWRIGPDARDGALRDATAAAIRDMEDAGLDIITDGEICRVSYTNHFSESLAGLDHDNPALVPNRVGREVKVPRVIGPILHQRPVELDWARFLRARTKRTAKVTLPGPFTLAQLVKDEHYGDPQALALAFAGALNTEARLLQDAGIDVIQFDEPWFRNDPKAARAIGVRALDRAVDGLHARTAVHVCFGYAFLRQGQKPDAYEFLSELADSHVDEISIEAAQPKVDVGVLKDLAGKDIALGVLDHSTPEAEPVDIVAPRIRAALKFVSPNRLLPSPDCGMKYMSRDVAFARLKISASRRRSCGRNSGLPGESWPMKRVTLTFDNGPTAGITDHVLDVLKAHDACATFFVVGTQLLLPGARAIAERAQAEGHWIGNHSLTHGVPLGDRPDREAAAREIGDMDRLLGPLAHEDRLFRPNSRGTLGPHALSPAACDHLVAHSGTLVLWTHIPRDRGVAADAWVADAQRASDECDWPVLVLHDRPSGHDIPAGAMAFLERYLTWARASGIDIIQDFPETCVPIRCGQIRMPLAPHMQAVPA